MPDPATKPSGSLSAIETYGSDDSDHSDDEENVMTSEPTHTSSIEMSEVAVAEASPAEGEADAKPASGSEVPSAAAETSKSSVDVKVDKTEEEDDDTKQETAIASVAVSSKSDVVDDDEKGEEKEEEETEAEDETGKKEKEEGTEKSEEQSIEMKTEEPVETAGKSPAPEKKEHESSDEDNSSDSSDDEEDVTIKGDVNETTAEADEDGNGEPMSIDEQAIKEENDEEEANGSVEQVTSENPWESPLQKPVNGVVQPRTSPPRGKPTRHTNCLDFVLFTVIKDALKHKHSWPFQSPVDANKLEIPEYHNVVSKPMDLRTIERRLRNLYYWCAEDAIKDINQLFTNCYTFNPPEYDIYKMAKTLEKQVLSQLTQLPRSDLNTLFDNCKRFNDRNDDIYIMCENIEGVVQRGLEYMPAQEKPADLAEHHRRGMFPASTPNGKTKTPKQRGRKSTRGRKKGSMTRGAVAKIEEMMEDNGDDESSKVDSINFDDEDDVTEKDVESRAESVQPEPEPEPKASTSQPTPAKKRKLENCDNGVAVKVGAKVASPAPPLTPVPALPPRKNPNTLIDWKSLIPRYHGKQAEWQKFCSKLLTEIHSVRNKGFAQVFYQPVDPIKLKIFDYLDVITNPMDLHTIKKKLDFKQYAEPEEFEHDMNLMVNNCCAYNPKGSVVHQNALDMKSFFDSRWKLCPRPGSDPIIAETYINQNLVVNTDLVEDEKINSYIAAVKAEEKKCAQKLELLRSMNEDLYKIAVQRRDAKLAGNSAPNLEANHLAQLDKLGITIKPTQIVPELISPALSVRSSSRAPVPKIIDDIGPSPIKSRKISKPRPSNASTTSAIYVTPSSTRGRKPKKSGRPKKIFSPNTTPPHMAPYVPPPRMEVNPYVSIYGRTSVGNKEKVELSERMANIPHEFITPVLRIIQIAQHNSGKEILSLRTLCEDEIDFNDASDDLVMELLDYLDMIKREMNRAEQIKQELEVKAKFYGFVAYDSKAGVIAKKRKVGAAPPNRRVRSDSPSPSASRSGSRSSESESDSDSSDDDSPVRGPPPVARGPLKRPLPISGGSSRASTPAAGPSRPVAANSLPAKEPTPTSETYKKRTLSESSSSSDGNQTSSDSSDSESSEPKAQPQIQPPKKKQMKKAPPPPPPAKPKPQQKKPPPLSILDELLPDTPEKKPVMASVPSSSGAARQISREVAPSTLKAQVSMSPKRSEEELRAQKEHEHNEALRRRDEARRRRALEDQPMIHQHEVMQAFESQYGDFSY
uniref:Bromo domain-containing protein n=1 Tax=Caenorhabditis japonica TaxID=281687 RepID=A0A8R1DVR4_CAEJA